MRSALIAVLAGLLVGPGPASAQPAPPPGADSAKDKPPPAPQRTGVKTFAGKTLSQWRAELKHGDPSRRTRAILAITQQVFEEEAYTVVSLLLERLHDNDLSPRAKAILALRFVEVKKEDVPRVVKALSERLGRNSFNRTWNERDATLRYELAVTLNRFARDAAPAIPALIAGTEDPASYEIRHVCAATLWRAARNTSDGTDPRAVKALVNQFNNPKATYEERLEILMGLGSLSKPTDNHLLQLVNKTLYNATLTRNAMNRPLAIWAYAALVLQGDKKQVEQNLVRVAKFLKDPDVEIRMHAVQALAALGPKAKSRRDSILAMLSDKEALGVYGACMALVRLEDNSDRVVDALLSVAKHPDPYRAGSAVMALVLLKANQPRVIATLDKLTENKKLNIGLRKLIEAGIKELQKVKEVKAPEEDKRVLAPKKPRR